MKTLMMLCACAIALIAIPTQAAPNKAKKVYVCPDCGCAADNRTFDKPGNCPECGMALIEKIDNKEQRPSVAILLFDNAEVIDYAGPWEVFGEAGFRVFTVADKRAKIEAGHIGLHRRVYFVEGWVARWFERYHNRARDRRSTESFAQNESRS